MKINNITLMVNSNEREGNPITGITVLRKKKDQRKIRDVILNQEINVYSDKPFEEDQKLEIEISYGRPTADGDMLWLAEFKVVQTIKKGSEKRLLNEYHYVATGKVTNTFFDLLGDGIYVVQGKYKISQDTRTTWDYFKVLEEE